MLRKVVLHSSRFNRGKLVLDGNKVMLGRCSPLCITDKRCSRTQVEISLDESGLSCTRLGVNPSFIQQNGKNSKELERNKKYILNNNDIISVFLNQYPVSIELNNTQKRSRKKFECEIKEFEASESQSSESPPRKIQKVNDDSSSDSSKELKNQYTIAFPSISTSTFQFDEEKAVDIACQEINSFLNTHKETSLKLYLVDISKSSVVQKFQQKMKQIINDSRFSILIADITSLYSKHSIIADCIVNAANSTLSDKGSGINKAIHDAVGSELRSKTKQMYPSRAKVGTVYPVTLESSSFRKKEKVKHILQVCGPNMNPSRANYLHGDYDKGKELLQKSYREILNTFYMKYLEDMNLQPPNSSKPSVNIGNKSHWKNALITYLENLNDPAVVYHDEDVVIVKDKFPKAQRHFLVLPKEVTGYEALSTDSIPLIKLMYSHAKRIAEEMNTKDNMERTYRIGFHAIPSMNQVHLHVISDDFDSDKLKNKKHWNSFTTEFFIKVPDYIRNIEEHGKVSFDKKYYEELTKSPLKCHKCSQQQSNLPKLKLHIKQCKI